ncbi:MAG: hypothetical protein ACJ8KU_08305, partial [Chthoniobacterales bacterium]
LENGGIFYGNPLDDTQLITDFDELRARGASYIVFTFGTRWWLSYYRGFAQHLAASGSVIHDEPDFIVYQLRGE